MNISGIVRIVPFFLALGAASSFCGEEAEKKDDSRHIRMTPAARKAAEFGFEPAGAGEIARTIEVPGEIIINSDQIARLSSKVTGNIKTVVKKAGDVVKAGDVLAIIDSAELGSAKIEFFQAVLNTDLSRVDLEREELLFKNTEKLIGILSEAKSKADIAEKLKDVPLGDIKTKILNAATNLNAASTAWIRAEKLKPDNLISGSAYDSAAKDLESAKAEYAGVIEELKLTYKSRFLQAQRSLRVSESSLQNTRRRLISLGVAPADIENLSKQDEQHISEYELRTPLSGTVIDKRVALGERVDESKEAFTVADLASVWVVLRIYIQDLPSIHVGQSLRINVGLEKPMESRIELISPLIDERTRTAIARTTIENKDGSLRPGTFLTASVALERVKVPIGVPSDSVHTLEGKTIVFIRGDGESEFVSQPVNTGLSDGEHVEIKSGLKSGDIVVVKNSFLLKAEIGKAAGDD